MVLLEALLLCAIIFATVAGILWLIKHFHKS